MKILTNPQPLIQKITNEQPCSFIRKAQGDKKVDYTKFYEYILKERPQSTKEFLVLLKEYNFNHEGNTTHLNTCRQAALLNLITQMKKDSELNEYLTTVVKPAAIAYIGTNNIYQTFLLESFGLLDNRPEDEVPEDTRFDQFIY